MLGVILAGGMGKRLMPLTLDKPKPMLEVAGRPILAWQLDWLEQSGIDSVLILAGYKHEKIEAYISAQKQWKDRTKVVVESEPRGTGGALKNAADELSAEKEFIVANGDTITNMDLSRMKLDKRSSAVISLVRLRSSKGIVETEGNRVVSFVEKPLLNYWMSAGIYKLSGKVIEMLPERGNIEETAFPEMAEEGVLKCVKYRNIYFNAIDSVKDLEEADKDLRNGILSGSGTSSL